MAIFNGYVKNYQMVNPLKSPVNIITPPFSYGFPMVFISDNATKTKRGSRLFGAQPLRECHTSQLSPEEPQGGKPCPKYPNNPSRNDITGFRNLEDFGRFCLNQEN